MTQVIKSKKTALFDKRTRWERRHTDSQNSVWALCLSEEGARLDVIGEISWRFREMERLKKYDIIEKVTNNYEVERRLQSTVQV